MDLDGGVSSRSVGSGAQASIEFFGFFPVCLYIYNLNGALIVDREPNVLTLDRIVAFYKVPGSLMLLGAALVGLGLMARRRRLPCHPLPYG